jgi:hypothetical protein
LHCQEQAVVGSSPDDAAALKGLAMNEFSGMSLLDPTMATEDDTIDFVPRPASLRGLKIGLIENTKKNAEAVLRKLADKLEAAYEMSTPVLVHKPQRAPVKDAQLAELKGKADFAIAGIGDCGACSSGSLLDAVILEKAGIPAVAIVTDAFHATAREMAELWGVPNFRFVMMPHPLASLTPEQIEERADELLGKVVALLQEGQRG